MKSVKRVLAIALVAIVALSVFSACSFSPEKKLIGTWKDSSGTAGYTFNEDGTCIIDYLGIDVSILGLDYDSAITGAYKVEKREDGNYYVTITYTVLSKSVTSDYMFVVEDALLTLTSTDDNSVKTFIRQTGDATASTAAPTVAS